MAYPMQCGGNPYDEYGLNPKPKKSKKKTKGRKTRRHDSDRDSMSDSASSFDEITYPEDEDRRRRRSSKCPFGAEGEEIVVSPNEEGLIVKRLYEGPRKCKCCTNWQREPPEAVVKQVEKTSVATHALTVYHSTVKTGDDTALKIASVAVRSETLKDLLKLVLKDDQLVFIGSKPVRLLPPFKNLYHKWNEFNFIRKYQQSDWSNDMPTARDQAKALFEIVKPDIEGITKDLEDLVACGLITYDLLWTLYPPGCSVFCNLNGTRHIMTRSHIMEGKSATTLTLTYRDWNCYGHSSENLIFFDVPVQPWTGTRQILDLEAVPVDMHPQRGSITETLAERGRRASEMVDGSCYLYKGMAEGRGTGSVWVDGRIIVDQAEYHKTNTDFVHTFPAGARSSPPMPPVPAGFDGMPSGIPDPFTGVINFDPIPLPDPIPPSPEGLPRTDFDYAQCRSVVRGFSLDTKSWATFDVDNITDVT